MIKYFKARLNERSSWAAIAAGVTAAAAVQAPFSYILIAIAVLSVLMSDDTIVKP